MAKTTTRSTRSSTKTTAQFEGAAFGKTVAKLRTWLSALARRRTSRMVTADDAHTYLDRQGVKPDQYRTRLRFINSVLRNPNFQQAGTSRSTRPVARGRTISNWTV